MKTTGRVLGVIGLVVLAVIPFAYFAVGGGWNWLFTVQAVLGAAFVAFFAATNFSDVGRIATGRGTFFVGFTLLATVLVLGLVTAGNYVAHQSGVKKDLTAAGLFTLSPDSVKTAEGLKEKVQILAFYRSDEDAYQGLKQLVARYQAHTKNLELKSIDPAKEPMLVDQYKISLQGNRVVVVMGQKSEKLEGMSEEALTNALVKLTRGASKKVYFTTGHGEADLKDQKSERGYAMVKADMENEGLDPVELNLVQVDAIPADAAAVVVAGPQKAFLPQETKLLEAYLAGGGRVMILVDPGVKNGLDGLLAKYGVQADDDLVLDTNRLSQILGTGPAVPMVQTYSKHPITEKFNLAVLFPTARSLTALNVDGASRPQVVALSSQSAWGETSYQEAQAQYDPGEKRGPLGLMVATTKPAPSGKWTKEARLVVFGDSEFADNQWAPQLGNRDLMLNSVNWLAEQMDRITIRAKRRASSRIFLTENQAMFLRMFSVNLLPLTLAAIGLAVWVVRKNR